MNVNNDHFKEKILDLFLNFNAKQNVTPCWRTQPAVWTAAAVATPILQCSQKHFPFLLVSISIAKLKFDKFLGVFLHTLLKFLLC